MTEVVSRQKSGKAATTCSVEGCETPALARGWCNRHYLRWRKYGNPTHLAVANKPDPWIRSLVNAATVYRGLRRHGVVTRSLSDSQRINQANRRGRAA